MKDFIAPQRVTVTNCGEVNIDKTDDAGAALEGAEFELYRDTDPDDGDTGHEAEDVATGLECTTSTGRGTCSITDVPFGEYWVVETVTPIGYDGRRRQEGDRLGVEPDVSSTSSTSGRRAASAIVKTDDDGNLLNGITFTASQGGPGRAAARPAPAPNPTGECTITDLNVGTYQLSEGALPRVQRRCGFPGHRRGHEQPTVPGRGVNPRQHKIITIVCHEGTSSS